LSHRLLFVQPKKSTCSSVEKSHCSVRIQNEDALFQGLKDVLEEPSFSDETVDKSLDLTRIQTV